jgi:flagellar hook assembly protein FlgD
MGSYGIFSSANPVFSDSSFANKLECQPRIFTPSGNLFEFNKTNILYNIESNGNQDVKVRIFNVAGRLKRILRQDNPSGKGNQLIVWDGKDYDGSVVPSGLYIVTLEKNNDTVLRTTVGVLNR